ncbi:hypothetical protein B0H12DRAFT_118182 [Mycena haematopus]|nr:hypothetical protein B0H12DRAFT_118182 [Mycena haematopus]
MRRDWLFDGHLSTVWSAPNYLLPCFISKTNLAGYRCANCANSIWKVGPVAPCISTLLRRRQRATETVLVSRLHRTHR